jgi:hypothetical protein
MVRLNRVDTVILLLVAGDRVGAGIRKLRGGKLAVVLAAGLVCAGHVGERAESETRALAG